MSKYKGIKMSFSKGYDLVPHGKAPEVRAEIMSLIGIGSDMSWSRYMRAQRYIPEDLKKDINKIFRKYKVKASEVWSE